LWYYTHLHSKSSVIMRAALFRADMAHPSSPPSGGYARPLIQATASKFCDKVASAGTRSSIVAKEASDGMDLSATIGGAREAGDDGATAAAVAAANGGEKLPPGIRMLRGHVLPADWVPSGGDSEMDPAAKHIDEDGNVLSAVGIVPWKPPAADVTEEEVDEFAATGVGFDSPAVHVPSHDANESVEPLFTAIKDGRGGWVGQQRATFASVVIYLVSRRGLSSKAKWQGMLVWWPRVKSSLNTNDLSAVKRGRRGRAGDRLAPQPYPVEVQQRHIPKNESSRGVSNIEDVKHITLTEVCPSGLIPTSNLVALPVFLFDKEPDLVPAVIDRKLAEHNVKRSVKYMPFSDDALVSMTVDEILARGASEAVPPRGPTPSASATPFDPFAVNSQLVTSAAPGQVFSTAVAARLVARRAAGFASQRAMTAQKVAEATKKAERLATRRRSEAAATSTPKKRPRVARAMVTRSEALPAEFKQPKLAPAADVQSCSILVAAAMLADHTYHSLATNWPVLETEAHSPLLHASTAMAEELDTIIQQQQDVSTVLDESTVRRARKEPMAKTDEMRGCSAVDAQDQCRVYVNVAARGDAAVLELTPATLQAISNLHTAAWRL